MKSEASIEIEKPIAEVFDFTCHHVPEWSLTVVEDELVEEGGPDHVGSRFVTVTEDRGRRMTFEGTVTRWEEPTLSCCTLVGQQFDIDLEYRFEDLGGERTRVIQKSEVTAKGFLKVIFFLLGWLMNKSGCDAALKELESLKAKAEAR